MLGLLVMLIGVLGKVKMVIGDFGQSWLMLGGCWARLGG